MLLLHQLVLLLVALVPLADGQHCAHFSQDKLLSRIESHVAECVGTDASSPTLSTLTENFVANEFDRRQPLALVLFSNSSEVLQSLSGAIASSLFGHTRSSHTVQSVDFQELLESPRASNYDMKQTLRSALSTPLRACPQRTLFVLNNVQALDDAALPVLDVFLDPLNGKRAQFQHYVDGRASQVYDCINSVFLFLYKVSANHSPLDGDENSTEASSNWREFLMKQWARADSAAEEFTPQAFVGRLTDAVAVFPSTDEDKRDGKNKNSRRRRQMCELQPKHGEGEDEDEDEALSTVAKSAAAAAPMIGSAVFLALPGYLLLLTRAKRWNRETMRKQEHGTIHRHSGKRKKRKLQRK